MFSYSPQAGHQNQLGKRKMEEEPAKYVKNHPKFFFNSEKLKWVICRHYLLTQTFFFLFSSLQPRRSHRCQC